MINFIHNNSKLVLSLPRFAKRIIAMVIDASLCVITLWIALHLRLDNYQFSILQDSLRWTFLVSVMIALPLFWLMGLYKTVFRYSSMSALVSIFFAISVYGLLYFSVISIYGIQGVPRSIGILQPILFLIAITISRILAEYILRGTFNSKEKLNKLPKALIYGAGNAGRQLLYALESSNEINVLGFVDDDKYLHGQILNGQSIFSPTDIPDLIISKQISHILLAIPSINRNKRNLIIKQIKEHKVVVKTLPSVSDIINGRVTTSDILEPDVDDILGRDQVIPDIKLMSRNIKSKKILITGAGGSIGSELSRQIIKLNPKKVLLLDISEYSLYKISSELEDLKNSRYLDDTIEIISILASVQDKKRISDIIDEFMPDVIYHTAAYKHVPLVEENIFEGIKNNIFGTLVCLQVAVEKNVSNMVLVSTDKAVRPTNVMGATKRIAELCIQGFYNSLDKKTTKFSIVRFGNVIDSSGSVIPKFKSQISRGGPVTLTHPEVTRYFMTIPEAAELVIQAGNLTEGCDIFVLDMGQPVKIKNLIEKMVNLSGLNIQDNENPDGDIKIEIVGLRQGEKLYEELLLGDNPQDTKHKKIKKAQDPFLPWNKLSIELEKIEQLMNKNDLKEILKILQKLVSGYKPNSDFIKKILTKEDNNELSKSFEKKTNNKIIHLKKNF